MLHRVFNIHALGVCGRLGTSTIKRDLSAASCRLSRTSGDKDLTYVSLVQQLSMHHWHELKTAKFASSYVLPCAAAASHFYPAAILKSLYITPMPLFM
jgi:hypothetical protein